MVNNDLDAFKEFMQHREDAGRSYVSGDAAPLGQIMTHTSPATFFSPRGDYVTGADAVWSRYEQDAASFQPGNDNHFDILDMGASDGIAYWVGLQRSTARLRGQSDPVPFNLRITEIFRYEGNEWKLVHRHADMLQSEPEQKPS